MYKLNDHYHDDDFYDDNNDINGHTLRSNIVITISAS